MRNTRALTLSLVLSVFVLFPNFIGAAISDGEGCFTSQYLQTIRTITIRDDAKYSSEKIGQTVPYQHYKVVGSKSGFAMCWVEISQGWIAKSESVLPVANTAISNDESTCYSYGMAYLTGSMNIREEPTTDSNKVGTTIRGEAYIVSDTHDGDDYCWLKTNKGWLAYISYVSHDIADILPKITGEDRYRDKVISAFRFIIENSPAYFSYTAPKIKSIAFKSGLGTATNNVDVNARIYVRERRLDISERYLRTASRLDIAMTLVHEACHVHQWDRGDRYLVAFLAEPECYSEEADALSTFSPGHPFIAELRCWARHYPSTFLCKY